MERLLGEVMEDMARDEKANKSALPAESSSVAANNSTVAVSDPGIKSASPVTKPGSLMMSTDTIETDKKRSLGPSSNDNAGATAKRPRSLAADVTGNGNNLEEFYSLEAKELQALLKKHQDILAGESSLLEKLKVPPANITSTPSLVLPPGKAAKYILIGLKDIQEALREQPINEELTISTVESVMSMWKMQYANEVPPDLEILIHHLEAVVARLGGKGGNAASLAIAPAPAQVSSLLEKLDAAHAAINEGLRRLEKEGPHQEGGLADLASIRNKQMKLCEEHRTLAREHQRLAEEYKALCEKETRMAAQTEKRAGVLADMMTSCTRHLQAHDDAVRTSSQAAESYTRRRAEAAAFLAAGGALPEIATVLSYKIPE